MAANGGVFMRRAERRNYPVQYLWCQPECESNRRILNQSRTKGAGTPRPAHHFSIFTTAGMRRRLNPLPFLVAVPLLYTLRLSKGLCALAQCRSHRSLSQAFTKKKDVVIFNRRPGAPACRFRTWGFCLLVRPLPYGFSKGGSFPSLRGCFSVPSPSAFAPPRPKRDPRPDPPPQPSLPITLSLDGPVPTSSERF